jgi:hypothetical protein
VKAVFLMLALMIGWTESAVAAEALLQGLDKVTGRVSRFAAPIGQMVKFGNLEITASACSKHPPEATPEASAFLTIRETHPGQPDKEPIFTGWMFASSPALNALEHPVYDVWVLDCK